MTRSSGQEESESASLPKIGDRIFCVTKQSVYVTPDCLKQLKSLKGSDASNPYDEEVGPEEQEFSDDEAEQRAKQLRRQLNRPNESVATAKAQIKPVDSSRRPYQRHTHREAHPQPLPQSSSQSTHQPIPAYMSTTAYPSHFQAPPPPAMYHYSPSPGVLHYTSFPQPPPSFQPAFGLSSPFGHPIHHQVPYPPAQAPSYSAAMSYVPGVGFVQSAVPYVAPPANNAAHYYQMNPNDGNAQNNHSRNPHR